MNDNFITEMPNNLSAEECKKIIAFAESDEWLTSVIDGDNINKHIRNSIEVNIPPGEMYDLLLSKTIGAVQPILDKFFKNFSGEGEGFRVIKYEPGGFYDWHADDGGTLFRKISLIWYLNEPQEGGETEFAIQGKIKPEEGKLVIFPSGWTHIHRSLPITKGVKYIIVTWIKEKI